MGIRIRHRRTGFTIVETVIVLLVVAIIAAIAAPRFLDVLAARRTESAAKRVQADLRLARQLARTKSSSQAVQFSAASNSYTLPGMADLDRPGMTYTVTLDQSPTMAALSSANFGSDEEIIFNGFGVPDTAGTATIRVGNYERRVLVDADGFIAIE